MPVLDPNPAHGWYQAADKAESALTDHEKEIVRHVSRCRAEVTLRLLAILREKDSASLLSVAESEIYRLAALGFRDKAIATKLAISELDVKSNLHTIFAKLQVSDRKELAALWRNETVQNRP